MKLRIMVSGCVHRVNESTCRLHRRKPKGELEIAKVHEASVKIRPNLSPAAL